MEEGTEYNIHTFLSSGNFEIASGEGVVEYLVVGGGGGGSRNSSLGGAGGNAGSVTAGNQTLSSGFYSVVVGAGGSGAALSGGGNSGVSGSQSSAFGAISAGGSAGSTTRIGGTGAGGPNDGLNGGPGLPSSITGQEILYAAGGGARGGTGGDVGLTYRSPNLDETPLNLLIPNSSFMNGPGVWFRIREPEHNSPEEPRREFVFMRGFDNNSLLVKYSRASKFETGGDQRFCPTSPDGVVVSDSTSLDADSTSLESASSFSGVTSSTYLQVVLNNENSYGTNGCFPFWIWCYQAATGSPDWTMVHENVSPATTSTLDQDPTYQICTGSPGQFMKDGVRGSWWEAYGLPLQTRRRSESVRFGQQIHAVSWSSSVQRFVPPVVVSGLSPYEGKVVFYPIMVGIPGVLFKGFSTGVTCSGFTTHNPLDVFKISTANPRILMYRDSTASADRTNVFFPWFSGVLPIV